MKEVYIVKRVYFAGWRCSKSSFPINDELENMNDNIIVIVCSSKIRALNCAYHETIALYDELTEGYQERENIRLKSMETEEATESELESWLQNVKTHLEHDGFYHWLEVEEWCIQ